MFNSNSKPTSSICQVWYCWRYKSNWSSNWCDTHRCNAAVGVVTGKSCGERKSKDNKYCTRHQSYDNKIGSK